MKKIVNFLKETKNKVNAKMYALMAAITTGMIAVPGFATQNPTTMIGNFTSFLIDIITAIGIVFLALGGFKFGMSFKDQEGSDRQTGIYMMVGGIIMVCIRFVINAIAGAGTV